MKIIIEISEDENNKMQGVSLDFVMRTLRKEAQDIEDKVHNNENFFTSNVEIKIK